MTCCCSSNVRISPSPDGNNEIVELRPRRHLRIQNLNPRKRDARFQTEMQVFLEYKKKGMLPNLAVNMSNIQRKTPTPSHQRISNETSATLTTSYQRISNETTSAFNDQSTLPNHINGLPSSKINNKACNQNMNEASSKEEKSPGQITNETTNANLPEKKNTGKENGNMPENIEGITTSERPSTEKSLMSVTSPTHRNVSRASVLSTEQDSRSVMSASNVVVSLDGAKPKRKELDTSVEKVPVIEERDELESNQSSINLNSTKEKCEKDSPLIKKMIILTNARNNITGINTSSSENMVSTSSEIQSHNSKMSSSHDQGNSIQSDMVLFFLHGVGGCSDIWLPQLTYFSNLGYEIVAPDMIGHGLSCAPDDLPAYHFNEILSDMEEVFDRYCKRKNVIVGHSYGCAFATVLARTRSRRVDKLILVSGGGPTPLAPQPGVFSSPVCLLACIKPCLSCAFKRHAFRSKSDLPVPVEKTFDIPAYVLSYIMRGQWWADGDDMYHSWIPTPTLLVYGSKDAFVHLWEEEEMHKTILTSNLEVIDNAGHMVMIEAPDKFNQLLHSFIDDQYRLSRVSTNQQPYDSDIDDEVANQLSLSSRTPRERNQSRMSMTSIKSCKSTKSMPRGLMSSRT